MEDASIFYGHLVHFAVFVIFYGHLVYVGSGNFGIFFPFWYFVRR
jgi:hypothetical protein